MKHKIICLLLVGAMVLPLLSGCGAKDGVSPVKLSAIAKDEIGSAMPEILLAENGNITFWGEFGLFIINAADGNVYRSIDLSKLESNQQKGCNHMTGDVITKFWISENHQSVYVINTGERVSNGNKGPEPHALNLEAMTMEEYVTGDLKILPPPPAQSFEFVGGEPDGYISNLVMDGEGMAYYLKADDWFVNQLKLVSYDLETGEEHVVTLFQS